ncbi:MAG TPA: lysylphosphatidylglycerol synthase domain-containing protein [Bdellovibrionota bacterium]|jgi:hypothetical protein|nr:lysylphosphatidylglycerol synthase domain-containing protein [Bdellovibrionota bacterium]
MNFRLSARHVLAAAVGVGGVVLLVHHTGLARVMETIRGSATYFPWIFLLEGSILACTVAALRSLYGDVRKKIPVGAYIRAGLVGYAVMGLVPAGRAIAEATRAALLSKHVTAGRAAVAAARLQAVSLLANSAISAVGSIAVFSVAGRSLALWLILGNMTLTGGLGMVLLLAGRHSGVGSWLGRKLPRLERGGSEFDTHFASGDLIPGRALAFEFLGRILQVLQNSVLVLAVGGVFGVTPALCSESLHLVGAAAGDLIPAQLGATEAAFQHLASTLGLQPAQALSIALLAHLAQVAWISVGVLMPILQPGADARSHVTSPNAPLP